MAILNLTPDSFSDGGEHYPTSLDKLRTTVRSMVKAGAGIIDVGGQSTRPGAGFVPADEEAARILPAISLIASMPEASKIVISVDTYHASVARQAVAAGAHMVNDVSAGRLDPDMLPTVAELGCTVCLTHSRGDARTMTQKPHIDYSHGLLPTVAAALHERVVAAQTAGVRRWRIILDPGLGFAKRNPDTVELLRRLPDLRASEALHGLPWLVGPSRKHFVRSPLLRKTTPSILMGTAAAVSAAISGGADIVRVHDVAEMAELARVADSIWRPAGEELPAEPDRGLRY